MPSKLRQTNFAVAAIMFAYSRRAEMFERMDVMSAVQAVERSRRLSRTGSKGVAREVAVHISYFIAGALVAKGAALGSLSPFGASLAAAVPFSYMPAAVLGSALSYLLSSPITSLRYVAVVISIAAIRWTLGEIRKLSDSRFFAPVVAFVPIFATGLALTLSSRSRLGEVYECIIEGLIAASGAYFFSRSASLFCSKRALSGLSQQELACLSMTGCVLLLSLSVLQIGFVSFARAAAVLFVLMFARYGNVKGGTVAGVATGVVFSLSDNSLLFLAAGYSLSGLVGGLLSSMGKAAVVFSALICNTMFAFAAQDSEILTAIVLETALASAVFMLIPKDVGNFLSAMFSDEEKNCSEEAVRRNVTMRLEHCSKALCNVTACVNSVSERLGRLYEPNANWVYEHAADKTCQTCGLRVYCWDKERDMTSDDFGRLTDILRERGYVKDTDIEESFIKRCCKCGELANSINKSYKEYRSLEAARRRVTQVRSVVAGQFAGLSDILHDLAEEFESIESYDTVCADRVIEGLSAMGLHVIDCCCRTDSTGGMSVEIELSLGRKTALSKTEIADGVTKACGRYFEQPTISFEGDRARVSLCELPLFDLEIGSAQHICDGGELCGDCLNYFAGGNGSVVAILSDGMGSGGRAAVDSNMAVSIMSKLCKAGLSYDCSLSVVNSSLMIKSEDESLATLDLLSFNCFTGRARLMKAGACTTFVRKNSKLISKDMPSLPLGILNEARFACDDVTLSKDDLIVMVSDGVLTGSVEWLERLIETTHKASAEELARLIVDEAARRRENSHDDDITAIAMRVVENV